MVKLGEAKRIGPTTKPISFKPSVEGSNGKLVKPTDGRKHGQGKWQSFEVERGSSLAYHKKFKDDKRTSHVSGNYKRKNPMTRSHWRREQKRRKAQRELGKKDKSESSTNVPAKQREDSSFVKRKFNDPAEAARERYNQMASEDEILTNNLNSGSEDSIDILVRVVSVMPREFDRIIEVKDTDNITEREMAAHKPVCYYVKNNG